MIRLYLKVYKVDNEVLVAVCDEKYLGKEFSDGNAQLNVSEKFYGNTPASCHEVAAALQDATIANLVGEESVACAIGRRRHRGGPRDIHRQRPPCADDLHVTWPGNT